jgi:phosphomevalonate kinase
LFLEKSKKNSFFLSTMDSDGIKRILLFSGKRKSGKDFITEKLLARYKSNFIDSQILPLFCFSLGRENAEIIRISEPIKSTWAKENNLDLEQLLSDGPYKEKYRQNMIVWSDEMRAKDSGIFCRAASENISKSIVIVSDIRRKTDIKWFQENFGDKIALVRILCDDTERSRRGWIFQEAVDDIQSECDLDDWTEWNSVIENNGNRDISSMLEDIKNLL